MAAGLLKGELAYSGTGVVGGQGQVVVPLVLHYIRGLVVENLQGESIILLDVRQGGLVG